MWSMDALRACIEKTWMELAPSSERVIEDADRMLVVLDKIIAAGGCVVPGEFLRTGGGRCARAAQRPWAAGSASTSGPKPWRPGPTTQS
jgi:hypothetical protein